MPWFSKQPDLKNNPLYLEPRIAVAESQMAQKANQNDVRLKSTKLGQLDMTEEFLQQMAGSTPINAVPADASLSVKKMAYMNVTTLNLHNPDTDTQGALILNGNGQTMANASYNASDYIPIEGGKQYYNSNALNCAFYDANKVYISGFSGGGFTNPYTAPANAKFVRHTYFISEYGVLCEGSTMKKSTALYGEKEVKITDNDLKTEMKSIATEPTTKGKKALLFGDSITQTHTVSEDGLTFTFSRTNWITYASEKLQLDSYKNFAKDGASYKDNLSGTTYQSLSNQINKAISTGVEADIIVVAAGTNDGVATVGDYNTAMGKTTLSSLDRSNLYEAIRWAFWTLRLNYPNATFYVGIPIQRADKTITYVEPMTTAIRKMAKEYNFIVVDGESESGIVKEFETWGSSGRYLSDGLHPNDTGKQKLANLYTRVIKNTYMS